MAPRESSFNPNTLRQAIVAAQSAAGTANTALSTATTAQATADDAGNQADFATAVGLTAQFIALNEAWIDYTPVLSATVGTITAHTAKGKYKRIGHTVFMSASANITNNGTASNSLIISLPVAVAPPGLGNSVASVGAGMRGDGKAVMWVVSPAAQIAVGLLYDGTYPGLAGFSLDLSITYVVL